MKKNNKKKSKKNPLQKFNDADAKKDAKITAMKSGIDIVGGIGLGTVLGSVLGMWAPLVGVLAIGAGHLVGDKSGVIRIVGSSMTAYGIATMKENRNATETSTVKGVSLAGVTDGVKNRLSKFKENWIQTLYIDKVLKKEENESESKDKEQDKDESVDGFGVIDISPLDVMDNIIALSAQKYNESNVFEEGTGDFEREFSGDETFEDETGEMITIESNINGFDDDNQAIEYAYDEVDFSTM